MYRGKKPSCSAQLRATSNRGVFFHSEKVVQIFPKRHPAQAACKGSAAAPVLFLSAGEKLLS